MKAEVFKPIERVALGVSFNHPIDSLFEEAQHLVRRLGASLRLIHACDPWEKNFLSGSVSQKDPDIVEAIREESVDIALQRLEALRTWFHPNVSIQTSVCIGEPSSVLAKEAEIAAAELIIVGATVDQYGASDKGISTAINLANETSVPVLVINSSGRKPAFGERGKVRLLIADNLDSQGEDAMRFAFRLAKSLGQANILHTHVNSKQEIRKYLDQASRQKIPSDKMVKNYQEEVTLRLRQRSSEELIGFDGEYRTEVISGVVSSQLEHAANSHMTDIAVFGHHELYHRGAAGVGQMTYKLMIGQSRPVIIVPQRLPLE